MEYNDLSSFERLTGLAFFTPAGQAGAINLGNIEMVKADYGTKSVDKMISVRGKLLLGRRDTYQAVPVFSIDGNQFASPVIPLLLMGDSLGDSAQVAGSGFTFSFTAETGLSFLIGTFGLTNVVVQVSSSTKTLGVDYFLDALNGIVSIPVTAAGISAGNTVVVTFDQPALALENYSAFTHLNRTGTLVVYAEDEAGPPAKEIWTMTVSLACKKGADFDPTKFRKFTLDAALLGNPTVQKRGGFEDLSTDDDVILDWS